MPAAAIHDFFKQIRLQDANQSGAVDQTLVADSTTDTLKITTHGGVIFENPDAATDSFGLNVDYSVNVPLGTTALTLTDIISNTSEVNFTGGPGVTVLRNSANELEIGLDEGYTAIKKFAIGADDSTLRFLDDGESALFLGTGGIATSSDVEGNITIDGSAFLQAETNDLTTAVTWTNVPDANITQSSVTQHQAALSITESQISDLQSYLTAETSHADVLVDGDFATAGFMKTDGSGNYTVDNSTYLTSFTETNDLTAAVTWTNVPDANITQSSVTQHQAALSITESQISDLQSYLTSYTETDPVVGAVNGLVKADGAGNISAAVAGTDYLITETLSLTDFKAVVAASTDFADFQTRVAAL